jgi:hypothetical protein
MSLNLVDVYYDDQCQNLWFTSQNAKRCFSSLGNPENNVGNDSIQGFEIGCDDGSVIQINGCSSFSILDRYFAVPIPPSGPTTACYPVANSTFTGPTYYVRQTCQAGIWSKTGTSPNTSGPVIESSSSTTTPVASGNESKSNSESPSGLIIGK